MSWKRKDSNTQRPSPAERLPSLGRSSRALQYIYIHCNHYTSHAFNVHFLLSMMKTLVVLIIFVETDFSFINLFSLKGKTREKTAVIWNRKHLLNYECKFDSSLVNKKNNNIWNQFPHKCIPIYLTRMPHIHNQSEKSSWLLLVKCNSIALSFTTMVLFPSPASVSLIHPLGMISDLSLTVIESLFW